MHAPYLPGRNLIYEKRVTNSRQPVLLQSVTEPGPLLPGWKRDWIMRLFFLLAVCTSMLFSTGCAVHRVKGEVAGVEVEARTADANGRFCPPGQAKKDNC